MKKIVIYTDGACSGNPGPGGWGAILMYGSVTKELSGGEANTTIDTPHISRRGILGYLNSVHFCR